MPPDSEKIQIIQGDITRLSIDAVVNAANSSLLGGGGVDGAIHLAAGPGLLAECKTIGGCPTGEARITKGYNLPAKFVIHTVGPIYRGSPMDRELLTRCYRNCFALAQKHQLTSIAFPAISCGVYGYPIKEAAPIALQEAIEALAIFPEMEKIIFVLFSSGDFQVYRYFFKKLPG